MTPADRKYGKSHEWVKIDGDIAIIGISDHAQETLGDITFVDLPTIGQTLEKGGECGVIESVKAASDLYSPISGDITEVNTALEEEPEIINKDPYEGGWILKIKGSKSEELDELLDSESYDKSIQKE